MKLRSLNYRKPVNGRYYITRLLFLERDTATFVLLLLLLFFVSYTLFLISTLCVFLCSNKTWLSESSSLLSWQGLLLPEHFLFCLTFLYLYRITNFDSHYRHYYDDYFHYYYCYYYFFYCDCHYYLFTLNAFNFY